MAEQDTISTSNAAQESNSKCNVVQDFYSMPSLKTILQNLLKLAASLAPRHDLTEKEKAAVFVDGAKAQSDVCVALYEDYFDKDCGVMYYVYVFGHVHFLFDLMRRLTRSETKYKDNVDGEFGIFMVDRDTFRINVVSNGKVKELYPIKITQIGGVDLYSNAESPSPLRCYENWEHLFLNLRGMLIKPLFIAIPKKLARVETDGM
jgi:hypothetical protein